MLILYQSEKKNLRLKIIRSTKSNQSLIVQYMAGKKSIVRPLLPSFIEKLLRRRKYLKIFSNNLAPPKID